MPPSRIAELDITTLAVQVFILAIIAGVLVYFFKNKTVSVPLSRFISAEAHEEKGSRAKKIQRLVIISFWILAILIGGFLSRVLLPMVVREKPKPQGDIFDIIQPSPQKKVEPGITEMEDVKPRHEPPSRSDEPARNQREYKPLLRTVCSNDASDSSETLVRRGKAYLSMNRTEEALCDFYCALEIFDVTESQPPVMFTNVGNDAVNFTKNGKYGTVFLSP
jgi:hypothetical protein